MKIKLLLIAVLACLWSAFPHQAAAQSTINCASPNNGRRVCPADTRGGVTLVRQYSQSPCRQYNDWGYTDAGIWVDHGCRADFQVGRYYPGGGGAPGGDMITCESNNQKRNYCRMNDPRATVTLERQISQAACVRGQTWGNDGQGIWVDRGCRAQFRVTAYNSGGGPGWWNSGPGHRPTDQPKTGACFFRDKDYKGDYFCLGRGNSVNTLPSGFNDNITAIQIFGNATVTIYNDTNFQSYSATTRRSVSDLRNIPLQGYNGKNWNNRISSISVQ